MLSGTYARPLPYRFPDTRTVAKEKRAIRQIYLLVAAAATMLVLLGYVWSQVNMTKLEYKIAAQYELRARLLEEQKRLNGELAALKAPKRIEKLARTSLGLSYPEMDQIIFVK